MLDEDSYQTVTFTKRGHHDGISEFVERTVRDKNSYDEIVSEFVWFLQNIGYTYIGGLIVLDSEGRELHNTMY